ncbi:hypothetical protein BDV93DRAFT_544983 [Ceratobasidium sp. AG-I]|nr:hypothetical protein BDV93DRAFT_544983 [Ceratobasidium sp. AG-I]
MGSESVATFDTEATHVPNLQLVFNKDNPSNCVLTPLSGSGPCYSAVSTSNHGSNMITTYRKSEKGPTDDWESQPIIATLKWREMLSDKLMLGDGSSDDSNILKSKFLSMTVSFSDEQGRKYEWQGCAAGVRMLLYEKGGKEALAGFQRSVLNHETGERSSAVLTISPRGAEIVDLVVPTFLALEKQRRMDGNSSANMGDALTSASIGIGNVTGGDNIYKHGV